MRSLSRCAFRKASCILLLALLAIQLGLPALAFQTDEPGGSGRLGKPDFGFTVTAASGVDTPANYEYGTIQISLSDEEPVEGVTVLINATVFNTGTAEGTVDVSFFDGPPGQKDRLGTVKLTVKALRYGIANATWNTAGELEFHTLFVVIDQNNTVDENNENNNNATKDVTVNFIPRLGLARSDASGAPVPEDAAVLFRTNVSDTQSDIGAGFLYNWSFDDGFANSSNPSELSGLNASSMNHVFTHSGVYNVSLAVTDDGGASACANVSVRVDNVAPRADFVFAGSSHDEDAPVTFDAGPSYDTATDISMLLYRWDFGDGNSTAYSTNRTIVKSYPVRGNHTVSLTVRDDNNASGTRNATLGVRNVTPTVYAGKDIEASEDDRISLLATANDTPSDFPGLRYRWMLGELSLGTGKDLMAAFPRKGIYQLTAEVVDEDGARGTDTVLVDVRNLAPAVSASGELRGNGSEVLFRATASDTPSDFANLTYSWDFGDGSFGNGANAIHRYNGTGSFRATVTVTDDDGAISCGTCGIVIRNSSPLVAIDGPSSLGEDEEGRFTATVSGGEGTIVSYRYDFGDGKNSDGLTARHSYARAGTYNVSFLATTDRGAVGSAVLRVAVRNLPPFPRAVWPRVCEAGVAGDFDGSGTNDSRDDLPSLIFEWDFGDGSTATGKKSTHSYAQPGEYAVSLRVRDHELANASIRLLVTVLEKISGAVDNLLSVTITVRPSDAVQGSDITVEGDVALGLPGGIAEVTRASDLTVSIMSSSQGWTLHESALTDAQGHFRIVLKAPGRPGSFGLKASVSLPGLEASSTASFSVREKGALSVIVTAPLIAGAVVSMAAIGSAGAVAGTDLGRYKFLAFFLPLFTRLRKDAVLDHFERGRIFEYIGKNPGAHYSEIHANLDMNNGNLIYHLKVLEREGYIGSRNFGMYRRFFPAGYAIPENDYVPVTELMVGLVTSSPGMGQKDIARELGVPRSTVNYHCNQLVLAGRISLVKTGPKKRYFPP